MTGVGGRPEVVLEGASQLEGPWTEIPFKYKPGAVDRPCLFVGKADSIMTLKRIIIRFIFVFSAPHQPRLDWQM